jgi:tRNA (guanine-N7-)-methyltransferase
MLSLAEHPRIFTSQDEIETVNLPKDKAIVIDMGCGHGDYMLAHCPDDTDVFWIGIDISRKRTIKTEKRLLREKNDNFILFADDGQDVLGILPANSVDVIHINFPDPWL